jgi:ABC-type amino acid transport substrate-binding protein
MARAAAALALAALALAAAPARAAAAAAVEIPFWNSTARVRVCASETLPREPPPARRPPAAAAQPRPPSPAPSRAPPSRHLLGREARPPLTGGGVLRRARRRLTRRRRRRPRAAAALGRSPARARPRPAPQFEVDLARRVFEQIGWPPAALEWKCVDWDEMLEDLYAGGKECDVAVAGIFVATQELEKGVVFSWPTMQSGFGILVRANAASQGGRFAFVNAFAWPVWVATILTGAGVGLVVGALDAAMRAARRAHDARLDAAGGGLGGGAARGGPLLGEGDGAPRPLGRYVYEGVSRPTQMREMDPISLPANLVAIVYGCALEALEFEFKITADVDL